MKKENDSIRRKASARRWLIVILTSVLAMLIGMMIWFVHSAWEATDDYNRVTTQTNVKMQVNLPGQTPSRAITRTYDADVFEEFSESEKQKILKSLSGKIEGDIPCVQGDSKENSQINLIFQDKQYNNIEPEIQGINFYTSEGMPPVIKEKTDTKFDYQYRDGVLNICLSKVIEDNELAVGTTYNENDEYVMRCYFVIHYKYENRKYASMTAVNVF